VKWYQLAAEQGVVVAQRNLGLMFKEGRGVPKDYVQAYKWFSLANAAGDLEAANNRDLIGERMTRDQLDQAQKVAKDWMLAKTLEQAAKCRAAGSQVCN
jgi:TPR repeat protein